MSRDSVRYGRVPKRTRSGTDGDNRVTSASGGDETETDAEVEKKQLALYDIILSVSQAHHSNCPYTEEKMKNVTMRPLNFVGLLGDTGGFMGLEVYIMYLLFTDHKQYVKHGKRARLYVGHDGVVYYAGYKESCGVREKNTRCVKKKELIKH
jgi:hypothetical protein